MKPFTIVILGIFGFFIVAGVIAVATFGKFGGSGTTAVPASGVIWGTMSADVVNKVVNDYNAANDNVLSVTYRQIPADQFDQVLAESLATGNGPDIVLISQAQVLRHESKLYPIGFDTYSERTYRDTYSEGAEAFLTQSSVLAFPVAVDPLVLYWNRTLFTNARIAQPPRYWDELLDLGQKLTIKDNSFNVTQSVVGLGEYRNVTHAKEILATLLMQAGDPISTRGAGNEVSYVLGNRFGLPEAPADSALRFYTEFANPVKPAYSWNRSLPTTRDFFLKGSLALYVGFGSELLDLQRRNPNLNFDMAPIPQVRESTLATTFGNIYALALIKQSKNLGGAYAAITDLTDSTAAPLWAQDANLSPVRRDLLAEAPTDPYKVILYKEALIARGFLDPDALKSGEIFATMVEDILFNRSSVHESVSTANNKLQNLLQ